ncbi:hypothetical protein CKJ90_32860, partial [Klebsiella pneumoniae]
YSAKSCVPQGDRRQALVLADKQLNAEGRPPAGEDLLAIAQKAVSRKATGVRRWFSRINSSTPKVGLQLA